MGLQLIDRHGRVHNVTWPPPFEVGKPEPPANEVMPEGGFAKKRRRPTGGWRVVRVEEMDRPRIRWPDDLAGKVAMPIVFLSKLLAWRSEAWKRLAWWIRPGAIVVERRYRKTLNGEWKEYRFTVARPFDNRELERCRVPLSPPQGGSGESRPRSSRDGHT